MWRHFILCIPSWYVASHSGQLSLLPSARRTTSTGQGTVAYSTARKVTVDLSHWPCVGRCGLSTYRFNGLRKGDKHTAYTPLASVDSLLFYSTSPDPLIPQSPKHPASLCACAHYYVQWFVTNISHKLRMAIRGTCCHYFVLDTRQYSHGVDRSGMLHNSLRMRTYARCLIICNSFTYTSLPLHSTRLTRSYFKYTILPQYHISIR